jgi:hypothetical protein
VVSALVFLGDRLQSKAILQFHNWDQPVQQLGAVLALHGPNIFRIAWLEFTGQRYQKIL